MNKKWMFEVQACETVTIEADTADEARMKLVENTDFYVDMYRDPYISDGKQVRE